METYVIPVASHSLWVSQASNSCRSASCRLPLPLDSNRSTAGFFLVDEVPPGHVLSISCYQPPLLFVMLIV
jgi:hypothetical protein